MNKSESIVKIASALVKAQSEMGNAVKDSKNPFFKSTFATLNAVREASLPVLNKHGVSAFQPTTVIDGKLYVETLLLHESGEYISGLYEVVVGKVNDPQATGAAVSYARRYALQAMVNIGSDDDDAESAMGRNTGKKVEVVKTNTTTKLDATVEKTEVLSNGKTGATVVEEAPPKKGGFGVKTTIQKNELPAVDESDNGWT